MTEKQAPPGSCIPVQNLISQLVEGKLTGEDEGIVLDHVNGCSQCQEDLATSQYFHQLLARGMTLPDPPTNFSSVILQQVTRKPVR